MTPLVLPRQRFWHTRCRRVGVIHTITRPAAPSVMSAVHLLADLTLGLGKVVHDYLK
jgi:acetoacetate decarboxylase